MILLKKSQAELITTILLILISIAAVVLVSGFIINMVRSNLVNTDCFKTTGQIKINLDEGYTYYNITSKSLSLSISRGEADINLTGIIISVGDGRTANSYKITPGLSSPSGFTMYDGSIVALPGKSETRTYNLTLTTLAISNVKIVPIIVPDLTCKEGSDEQTIPSKG